MKREGQKQRIKSALQEGDKPCWYFPNVLYIMNHTARISELRADGDIIKWYCKDDSKTTWYHLAGSVK